jgi:hypothetical protein
MSSTDRLPSIVPLKFWKEYEPQTDGSIKEIEMVEWVRKGSQNATTIEKISRMSKRDINGNANPNWHAIKPFYESWKEGQEAPVNGTPLAAWPGATPHLVKALEPYHVRSVEDLADLTDGTMARIPLPGIRGYRDNAKAYVTAMSTTAPVAAEVASLREQNANYETRINELEALVKSLAAERGIEVTEPEAKRGPGRPRKVAA